jgi:hypothetical protein
LTEHQHPRNTDPEAGQAAPGWPGGRMPGSSRRAGNGNSENRSSRLRARRNDGRRKGASHPRRQVGTGKCDWVRGSRSRSHRDLGTA